MFEKILSNFRFGIIKAYSVTPQFRLMILKIDSNIFPVINNIANNSKTKQL